MNQHGRSLALACLLSMAAAWLHAPPAAAQARSGTVPAIEQFYVEGDEQLRPGSKLMFTVEGTPGAKASVRISGLNRRIPLKEIEEGVYEGSYIVKSGDQIGASTTARATLQRRNRSASALLGESLGATVGAAVGAAAAIPAEVTPSVIGIESFSVTPVDRLEPGAELGFTMNATPGGQATFTIEGVAKDVPMRELNAGQYVGSYTVRRNDRIAGSSKVAGALTVAGRTLRTNLGQSLVVEGTVSAPGPAAASTVLPLQVLSHQNMAAIGPGLTEVRGRTAPGASVQVQVRAVSAVFGYFGVSQNLLSQTVQADANGDFAFRFQPVSAKKDMRYEVTLTASKGGQSSVENLVLTPQL